MNFSSKYVTESFSSVDMFDRMLKTVQEWYVEQAFFDVTIECTDGTVQAHKHMLASASPYFRSLIYGSMLSKIGMVEGKIATVAINANKTGGMLITCLSEFKCCTVKLFLDCIYRVSTFDSVVDVIEFARFCDYIHVPELFRESLRLAGTQLRHHDCVDDLNAATSVTMQNLQWIEAIVVYIQTFVPFNTIKINESSEESRKWLMSCIPLNRASLALCFLLAFKSMPPFESWKSPCTDKKKIRFMDFWFSYSWELCQFAIDIDYDFEANENSKVQDQVNRELLKNFSGILKKMDKMHCSLCPRKHNYVELRLPEYSFKRKSEQLVLMLFSYEFHPARNKLYHEFTPQSNRFIESARNHIKNDPEHDSRFFLWKDTLCSVRYIRGLRFLDVDRYAWHRGNWDNVFLTQLYEDQEDVLTYGFRMTCCHIMKDDVLAVAIVERFANPCVSHLFFLNLKTEDELVVKVDLGESSAMEMYMEGDLLFVFEHPWKVLKFDINSPEAQHVFHDIPFPDDLPLTNIVSKHHSALTFTTFQRILEFRGRIYFIYCISRRSGISIAKLNSSTMQWEEQSTKLSDEYWLFDAFVANNKLYVVYGTIEEDIIPHGEESMVIRKTQFIAVGCCKIVKGKRRNYEFHLVHDKGNPQMNKNWYSEHNYSTRRWKLRSEPRLVVPKYAFQLDYIE